jgi:hypothetical protein
MKAKLSSSSSDAAPSSVAPQPKAIAFWWILPLLLLVLSALFFSEFDVLRKDFGTQGARLLTANLLRVGVIACLGVTLYCGGVSLGRIFRLHRWSESLSLPERFLIRFSLGGGGMAVLMLPLGLMGLFYRPTAVFLAAAFVIPSFDVFIKETSLLLRRFRTLLFSAQSDWPRLATRWILTFALFSAALFFLVSRCLYPGETSNDSYEIYWPYQIETISSHTLRPNDLWYMFCAFNGAGINFWSMLVTDLLGIQSATYLFLLSGALSVYCVCRRLGLGMEAALGVAFVSVQCFAFTNPHWGAFQSHHLQTASWLVGVVWMTIVMSGELPSERMKAAVAGGWMLVALALLFPLFLVFLLPMLGGLWLLALGRRDFSTLKGLTLMMSAAGTAAVAMMLLNYFVGGMPLSNPLGPMWKLADQARFSQWCSPYNVHYIFEGSEERTTNFSLGGLISKPAEFWIRLLRLQSFGWIANSTLLAALASGLAIGALSKREKVLPWIVAVLPVLLPLGTCLLITNTSHPDSVYRNYGFVCFLIPPLLFSGWNCVTGLLTFRFNQSIGGVAVILASISAFPAVHARYEEYAKRHNSNRLADFVAFATGQISVQEALIRGDGLWDPSQNARNAIGLQKPLFSFVHPPMIASFLFPGPGLLTEPSRCGLGGKWDAIVFGDAESAKAELQKQGIDFFLIDFRQAFRGALPCSPLFDPSKLSERFDLVTALESSVVLTWKGAGQPMPEVVAQAWRQRVSMNRTLADPHPDGVMSRLYENIKAIYDFNRDKPLPIQRPPDLRKVMGWQ